MDDVVTANEDNLWYAYERVFAHAQEIEELLSLHDLPQDLPQPAYTQLKQKTQQITAQLHQLEEFYRQYMDKASLEQRLMAQELATRLQYEETLSVCSQILLAHIETEEALTETLYELLVATGVSRVYICENITDIVHRLCFKQIQESCALNVNSKSTQIQNYPYQNGLDRWQSELSNNRPIFGPIGSLLAEEQEFLKSADVSAILILPVWVEGIWYGFVAFEDIEDQRQWSGDDIKILQAIVDMIGGYIGRKNAEKAQRESEEKYRTLIEQSSDAIFLIYGGKFELVNPRFTEMFGVTQKKANQPDFQFTNIIAPQSREMVKRLTADQGTASRYRPRYEFIALDKNGNEIFVELTVSYPIYKRGLATQGIIRDITERKRIEEERKLSYMQIQQYAEELAVKIQEEQRQREITAILAEVVASVSLTLSTDKLLTHILVKLQQLVRYDAAAVYLINGDHLVLEAAHGLYADFISKQVFLDQNALFEEMQIQKSYILINNIEQSTYEDVWFSTKGAKCWIGAPLLVAQEIIGFLSVDRHLTGTFTADDAGLVQAFAHQVAQTIHNARLFAELQEAQNKLIQRERLAALGQMSATVAHELRNPLMSLRMGLEYLLLGKDEEQAQQRAATIMQSNMDRIERIVENILYAARVPEPNLVPGSLKEVLENEIAQWELNLVERNVDYKVDLADNLPAIAIDMDQMERAVSNLINNSIDAMDVGGQLKIGLYAENGDQIITVSDNGSGISQEVLSHVFEPFFTTKARGTGLGLAIVKQIVDSHKGNIQVFSQEGKGTRFVIKLPQTMPEV